MAKLFEGAKLISKEGEVEVSALKDSGKVLGIYFSAHWCPPCRGFTPALAEAYTNVYRDKLEIVFVSSDRDEKSFKDYFKDMPWLALDFSEREKKEELGNKFNVRGIPTLIILDDDGNAIDVNGRATVTSSPTAFPAAWSKK